MRLEAKSEEAEEEAGGHDPHVWFSVANAKVVADLYGDSLGEGRATEPPT
jgi:ABC-type Zn uptake system ZnuABC Zn-binding protein ZnuA